MAIDKGIHVFYISPRKVTGSRDRREGVNLYWLHMNGTGVLWNNQINLGQDVAYGVAAIMDRGWLNLFVTFKDKTLHKVSTQDGKYFYNEQIPDVRTMDVASAVHRNGSMNVFFKNENSGNIEYKIFENDGRWSKNIPVFYQNKAIRLEYGPCAIMRGQDLYLFFRQDDGPLRLFEQLKALRISPDGRVTDFSRSDFLTSRTPGAVLLPIDDKIMVAHRGSNNNPQLYTALVPRDDRFPQKEDKPDVALLNDYPGLCMFGDRVYTFFQGTDNNLYVDIYMGDRWLSFPSQVRIGDQPVGEVWWGPAVLTV